MAAMDNAHALVVGIANYRHVVPLPPTVLNDARAIYEVLIDPARGGYCEGNVERLLHDLPQHAPPLPGVAPIDLERPLRARGGHVAAAALPLGPGRQRLPGLPSLRRGSRGISSNARLRTAGQVHYTPERVWLACSRLNA